MVRRPGRTDFESTKREYMHRRQILTRLHVRLRSECTEEMVVGILPLTTVARSRQSPEARHERRSGTYSMRWMVPALALFLWVTGASAMVGAGALEMRGEEAGRGEVIPASRAQHELVQTCMTPRRVYFSA